MKIKKLSKKEREQLRDSALIMCAAQVQHIPENYSSNFGRRCRCPWCGLEMKYVLDFPSTGLPEHALVFHFFSPTMKGVVRDKQLDFTSSGRLAH